MSSMNTSGIDGGPGGAGYAFAKIAAAHYVNDFARALADVGAGFAQEGRGR